MDKSQKVEEIINVLSEIILNYITERKEPNDLILVKKVPST